MYNIAIEYSTVNVKLAMSLISVLYSTASNYYRYVYTLSHVCSLLIIKYYAHNNSNNYKLATTLLHASYHSTKSMVSTILLNRYAVTIPFFSTTRQPPSIKEDTN